MTDTLSGRQFAAFAPPPATAADGPSSFLKPRTATGAAYTPSYTAYQNSPFNSYTHPTFGVQTAAQQRAIPTPKTPTYGGGTGAS